VNGGQLLQRWTNDYFLATPHRAVNRSGGERDALAFFCDANIDSPVAAVPTCLGPDKPPKYPTIYYTEYIPVPAAELQRLRPRRQGCRITRCEKSAG
jgi:isopenicillin N synthase-like dioxygenase